jgi:hypothetical protein
MNDRLTAIEVASPFLRGACYRYIRHSDRLPVETDPEADAEDVRIPVKLFNPTGLGTWWIASFNPETGIAYGVAEFYEREAGTFWMRELIQHRGMMGLPIERDLYFRPTSMAEILKGCRGH